MRRLLAIVCALTAYAFPALVFAQTSPVPPAPGVTGQNAPTPAERKQATATRIERGTIRVDGRLKEAVWFNKYGTDGTTPVVNEDGSQTVTADGSTFTLPNRDFNTLSFRSNVVLRWEWRPGSTLFVVWQQALSDTAILGDYVNIGDMFRSVTVPGPNLFVVKTTFWLPIR